MSTENMRKLIMLAESLDEDYRDDPNRPGWKDDEGNWHSYEDETCPHCHGWGEYIDPEGFDEPVVCPHCDPDDEPIRKSRLVKDMAMDMDMDWTDLDLVDVDPADLKGFPKVEEDEWDVEDFPVNESFTRKHFRMVADTLQKIEDPEVRRAQAEEYAAQFAAANPRFNRDLFMQAAGVEELNEGPDANDDWGVGDYVIPAWEQAGDYEVPLEVIGVRDDQVLVQDDFGNRELMFPEDLRKAGGELDEVQTLPREIKNRKPIKSDWSDVEYETCADCGVEGGHENDCPTLAALYKEPVNEEQSEFRLAQIVGKDNFAELVSDLNTGGIDYSAEYFKPLYWHFLDEYPDEIPVGSRTGRPEDPEEYVLDNLERYHSDEIKQYMNTPDMDESNCGVCGETFKWEGSPDEEMCPRCTQEYLGEDDDKGKPYICVHVKKGKHECYADSSYAAAKKAAEHWGLKSTAGIDAHLAIDESSCPCGKEDCECGPDCDCEPLEESMLVDLGIIGAFLGFVVAKGWPKVKRYLEKKQVKDVLADFERGVSSAALEKYKADFEAKLKSTSPQSRNALMRKIKVVENILDQLADFADNADKIGDDEDYMPIKVRYLINRRLNDAMRDVEKFVRTSNTGHDRRKSAKKRAAKSVQEAISLDSIVESILDEYRNQPKDYEMSDEELAAEIEDETSEFERDHIDKEIEDEELGLRFD